jgi:D-glucosaminate-6-phosphate ammonia-lyase
VWHGLEEFPNLDELIALAHRHDLPVIVDGAYSMPPTENLTSFSRRGVDLIAYSGGKHLGGPQASGMLCGRADLIRNAWVQMVDMDVRARTWSLQHWIENGWISRSPRHGVGRSMKVSKEAMIGLMTALERYTQRDHAAEQASWKKTIDDIYEGLRDQGALQITRFSKAFNGQPYPLLQIDSGSGEAGLSVRDLILALRSLPRKILLAEDEVSHDRAYLYPQCLRPGESEYLVAAIQNVVISQRNRSTR